MSGRILLAALISEVGGIFTSWLITGHDLPSLSGSYAANVAGT
jgi:hypothetical protein